jgi:hypothetical protein
MSQAAFDVRSRTTTRWAHKPRRRTREFYQSLAPRMLRKVVCQLQSWSHTGSWRKHRLPRPVMLLHRSDQLPAKGYPEQDRR